MMHFRLLSMLFLLLAFVTFLFAVLERYFHAIFKFIPHDAITLLTLTQTFLIFSIALAMHVSMGGRGKS